MSALLHGCRSLIVSEPNLRLLGTAFSYKDYEVFFEKELAPLPISPIPLLDEPETIIRQSEDSDVEDEDEGDEGDDDGNGTQQQPSSNNDDDLFFDSPAPQQGGNMDFDDDFFQ